MEELKELNNFDQTYNLDTNYINHISNHHIGVFINLYIKTKFDEVAITRFDDYIQAVAISKDVKLLIDFSNFDLKIKVLEFQNLNLDVNEIKKEWFGFVYKRLMDRELKCKYRDEMAKIKEQNLQKTL